jgi:aryl-alcohol dehydrogenase-like predicted oxidoreductase
MERVTLGRTGLRVSVAGLGCGGRSRLGIGNGHDEWHATRVVEHAIDRGVNVIDTARGYGTEAAVGRAVRGKRDRVVLSTKVAPDRDGRPLSAAELVASLEASLDSLGTDYVDVLHLHGLEPEAYPRAVDELLPELKRQQHTGKVRFLGVTEVFARDTTHGMIQQALVDGHFDVVMVGFNLLNHSARRSVFPQTTERNIGTMIMFAVRRALSRPDALADLVAGLVADGVVSAEDVDVADPLGFLQEFAGVKSVVEMAYRYCSHEPGVDVVLTGTGDPAHLDENLEAVMAPPLPRALTARIDGIFKNVDSVSGN